MLKHVLFSARSFFKIHGYDNRPNCQIWSIDVLCITLDEKITYTIPWEVNFLIGTIRDHNIIGEFFIERNLNGKNYLAMLQNNDMSILVNLYPVPYGV